ncbi:acyltransferase family protein, partial [Rathayibacter tanaceti]|uniref:acyltransferase family protein n=1 Tax=Rathayibacter tanaceti TaxID=1671680 RepID=UPI000AC52245
PSPTGRPALVRKADASGYRPEIEGLRAVASLLVASFHIWLGRVSGGVDVFFVVAGFLTTLTLVGQVRRYGRVRPVSFLTRLASRLFPAAAVVLVAVAALAPLLLRPSQLLQTFTEVLASTFYVENIALARAGVDYLAQDDFHSPVQNFWAMSVQGQFYLIWLALVLVATLVAVLLRTRALLPRILLLLVAALTVLSFAFSVVLVGIDQPTAYYSTLARSWEFGLGSLAALLLPGRTLPAALRAVAGWLGLIGVVSCGLLLQVSTAFPGAAALWPTLSAVLVLVAGTGPAPRYGVARLLALRPLVWLGGISYGLYLWHWPLLVLWRERTGEDPGALAGLGIIAAAVLLAAASKRFLEDPLHRRAPAERPRRLRSLAPAALLSVAALAGVAGLTGTNAAIAADLSRAHALPVSTEGCVGAAALDNACPASWTTSLPALDASEDGSVLNTDECSTGNSGTELKECRFGDPTGRRVLLIGNSHAASFFPALRGVAEERGWDLHTFYKTGCVFSTAERRDDSAASRQSCTEWVAELQEELAAQDPYDLVVTAYSAKKSVFVDAAGEPDEQAGIDGFRESWAPLIARGSTVVAIRDNPVLPSLSLLACAERPGSAEKCRVPLAEAFADRELMAAAADGWPGAASVDLTRWFCDAEGCPLVIGGVKVYRDLGHLTESYARTLAPALGRALDPLLD